MKQLCERANTLAGSLKLKPYGNQEREQRNRGERTAYEHLRYRSYYDYFRTTCAPAQVVSIDKRSDGYTFALGANDDVAKGIHAAIRAIRRDNEPNGSNGSSSEQTKVTRLNIRLTEHQKQVITHAANLRRTTLSAFVLEMAYDQAQTIIGEQTEFRLPDDKWQEFCAALDAPPKEIPQLRELLTEPSIFDE
jgi:uncharacterized protein (DUF1778 family)